MIETLVLQNIQTGAGIQAQINVQHFQHPAIIAKGLVKLLLAGNPLGQIELPADFR